MLRATVAALACAILHGCGEGEIATSATDTDSTSDSSDAPGTSGPAPGDDDVDVDDDDDGSASMDGDTTTATSTDGGDDDPTGFRHEVHTLLTAEGRLALTSNLPPSVTECRAIEGAPCDDADLDDLVDAWEDAVLDRLRPLRRFDEAESLLDDATAVMADVGRVAAVADGFRVFVMLGYSRDYGSCGLTSHNGDSERVAIDLAAYPEGDVGGVVMRGAYTAAHEGTVNDHGRVFSGDDLAMLVFTPDPQAGEPRWVVFPSADKHATYASVPICEAISTVPCVDEDCGPDGVADIAAYEALPVVGNAGEEATPRLTDLARLGFPGDDAWADQSFCGGLGGTGCSASVRSKLLMDPF